ncbi:MAG: hypothetical protein GY952_00985 [Rhodobacteraceae bacterium]|nr:hypothetical protein [Paracoccaceae bacterium]
MGQAILNEPTAGDCRFSELTARALTRLNGEELSQMGSPDWHVTSVKLEPELRGKIARPQAFTHGKEVVK